MDLELLIHPAIAASAVILIASAYLLKTRTKIYYRLHYAAGILAFSLSMVAFPLGLYYVLISGGFKVFPTVILFHTINFSIAIGLIVLQGALGMGMLLFGRRRWDFRTHKRMAKYVLAVFIIQGGLGVLTLYGIIPFVTG